ncbi:homoserine dehydrogenase [Streptomyces sp. NPDC101393]|uniref:homoserine dehydrogenase n=1 Tax=Streptomyces sp. NPDC101393 TaxID=3366141 RepID=UPI00382B2D73
MNAEPLKVAVLGCGVVGTEVVRRLSEKRDLLADRIGAPIELAGVAVRDLRRSRGLAIDPQLWTDDPLALVKRDDVDIVVELLSGTEPAHSLITTAMEHGASVVSANKALLATHGPALHETAALHDVDLTYEASVAAAIPLLRPLRDSLGGDRITRVVGVVNGTTNYILDRMTQTGGAFGAALREAVERGYAEADPTADVAGTDAAFKAVILASLAFHTWMPPEHVYREGITGVTATDVADARACDRVVKLVAVLERIPSRHGREGILARVHPAMVPRTHPLADVRGADNGVIVETPDTGPLLFRGAGAGGAPTSSAVVGDLVTAARRRVLGHQETTAPATAPERTQGIGDLRTRYHLRIGVNDSLSGLDGVTSVLRFHDVGVDSARRSRTAGRDALVVITDAVREPDLRTAVDVLAGLPSVDTPPRFMRLLDPADAR